MLQNYNPFISFWSFYKKEMARVLKVWGQTILGPMITTTLFLVVFIVSVGNQSTTHLGYTYAQFLVPGLVMMTIIQNSFSHSSSSLMIAKINGNIVDLLMAPVNASFIVGGYVLSSITRGVGVGIIIILYTAFFVDLHVYNIWAAIYFAVMGSTLLALLGTIGGIVSVKFDQLANFTNLVITPLSFLSGTFFSTKRLPEVVQPFIHYNPFFYMIDGFRYAFIGVTDFNVYIGGIVLFVLNIILYIFTTILWARGYRIKS
ncbi:multidrug ABC transporter permease [Candidatus Hepatincola sp. Pdp]